jgi:hypothetical protein
MKKWMFGLSMLLLSVGTPAQEVLPVREQSALIDELLRERFEQVLPALMQRENIY